MLLDEVNEIVHGSRLVQLQPTRGLRRSNVMFTQSIIARHSGVCVEPFLLVKRRSSVFCIEGILSSPFFRPVT